MTSEKPDRRDVIVAEYLYRHEAEFAAGFLADAGIPYRLEADDAGGIDAGVTMSRPARVWVRREDADAAIELLEVTPEALMDIGDAWEHTDDEGGEDPTDEVIVSGQAAAPATPRRLPVTREPGRLGSAERGVALTLGAGLTVLGFGFQDVLGSGPGGDAWVLVVVVLGVALLVSGVAGRTWGPLRAFLRAISGEAP